MDHVTSLSHETPASIPHTGSHILVVDDENAARCALAELLREEGFVVRSAGDGFKALGQLDDFTPNLVITDVQMPGMTGLEMIEKMRCRIPGASYVVMTAFASVEDAVKAMHDGADDYLSKPVVFSEMLDVIQRVLQQQRVHEDNVRLKTAEPTVVETDAESDDPTQRAAQSAAQSAAQIGWIGRSAPARELMGLVRQVAGSEASALILGEPGTGKELVARALHRWSARNGQPFETVRCSAYETAALDRELFGEERLDADGHAEVQVGRLERAAGGTLLLEDVDALSLASQVKLLRVLQDGEFERMGGGQPQEVDVRLVATTTKDLAREVADHRFREDLRYRLNVITLRIPSLRERRDDVAPLAMQFLRRAALAHHKAISGLSDRALGVLTQYEWPGNVRQLENVIERAVVVARGPEIEPKDLPREVMAPPGGTDAAPQIPGASMAALEKYAILKTLEHVGGSTRKAAEILGISTRKIQYRLGAYRDTDPSGLPAVLQRKRPDGEDDKEA
jgi:two-component system response regulator HydG